MANLEFEKINRGNQPTQDGAGTDEAWTLTGKINRNFQKLLDFLPAKFGTAATRDTGTASGNVVTRNTNQGLIISASRPADVMKGTDISDVSSVFRDEGGWIYIVSTLDANGVQGLPINTAGFLRFVTAGRKFAKYEYLERSGHRAWIGSVSSDEVLRWKEYLTGFNTLIDSNGFIKEASPVIKLFNDKAEKTYHLEIENAEFERISTGHYKIKNAPDLSRDGWYIETPKDRNGNVYFTLDYEELGGELIIKTYEPDYSSGKAENGAPVDILEGRFVSLRFAEDPSLYPEPEDEIGEE